MSYAAPDDTAVDFDWSGSAVYSAPDADAADLDFSIFDGVKARAKAASPLGAFQGVADSGFLGLSAAASMLGAPEAEAEVEAAAKAAAPAVLGAPAALGAHNVAWIAEGRILREPAALALQYIAHVSAPGPLGAPAAVAQQTAALAAAASMLGEPVARAFHLWGRSAAPSPLRSPAVLGWHDFSARLPPQPERYVCDLATPSGAVRVPISGWQATLQTGAKSYLQVSIPDASTYASALAACTAFSVSRIAAAADGAAISYPMASAARNTLTTSRTPSTYSATITGYGDAFQAATSPPAAYDVALTGVRSTTSTAAGVQARCSTSWTLRPGHRAYLDGQPIIVSAVSFFVGTSDAYMDANGAF